MVNPQTHVEIREVGPRDGLQTARRPLTVSQRIELLQRLSAAGVTRMEAGSFVHPGAVPLMADSDSVVAGVSPLAVEALIANARGAERARDAQVDAVVMVVTASETFNLANSRMSIASSMREFEKAASILAGTNVRLIGAVGTAFGCPFEGPITQEAVLRLCHQFAELGTTEVLLADTTGVAGPRQVAALLSSASGLLGATCRLGFHAHNTRGLGLVNVAAALDVGISLFDSSVGGIGGCPFAPDAAGNVCTEDLVHMLQLAGIETGVDLDSLIAVARWLEETLGYELPGQLMKAGPSSRRFAVPPRRAATMAG